MFYVSWEFCVVYENIWKNNFVKERKKILDELLCLLYV